jgi:hypothetical protein
VPFLVKIAVIAFFALLYFKGARAEFDGDVPTTEGTPVAAADGYMPGFSIARSVAQLRAIYEKVVEQLKELKAQSESLKKVRDGIEYMHKEYEVIQNASLTSAIEQIRSDADDLTGLDNARGKKLTLDEKFLLVHDELDRRLKDPAITAAEKEELQHEKNQLNELERQLKLKKAAEANLKLTNGKTNDKSNLALTAQNTAITATAAANGAARDAENDRRLAQDSLGAQHMVDGNVELFKVIGARESVTTQKRRSAQ